MIHKPRLKVLPYIDSVWIGMYERPRICGKHDYRKSKSIRSRIYDRTPNAIHRMRFRRWMNGTLKILSIPFN